MKKSEPKKRTPGTSALRIRCEDGKYKRDIISEDYPSGKKDFEKSIAERFVNYLKMEKNRELTLVREQEHPDFVYSEEGRNVGIELMSLEAQVRGQIHSLNQRYTEDLQMILNAPKLHVHLVAKDKLPDSRTDKGKAILKELGEVIRHVIEGGPKPDGLLERQLGGYVFHTEEGILGRFSPDLYFSLEGINIGIAKAFSHDDYNQLNSKLKEKWLTDYSESECTRSILVLHSFVRPDFLRIRQIIKDLNEKYSEYFSEIWYLKPYSNNIDDVRCLSC